MELSKRGKLIVKALYCTEAPLTSKKIAEKLDVSMRTIQYELRDIEDWAMEHEIELEIKPHVGIRLLDKEKAKNWIEEFQQVEEVVIVPTNNERVQIILLTILESIHAVRVVDLIHLLDVSKTTILKDLIKVEEYLAEHDIKYIRDKKGIQVTDCEIVKRNQILHMIYEDVKKQKLIEYFFHSDFFMMKEKENYNIEKYIGSLVDEIDIDDLKTRICRIQECLKIILSDLSFVGLIIHISLSIKRLREYQPIQLGIEEENRVEALKEYTIIEKFIMPLETMYQIQFTKSEMCYLVMHFITSQVTKSEIFQENELCDELLNLIYQECQIEYQVDFFKMKNLRDNFLVHLQPAVIRMKYGVSINNPILDTIKEQYPESFLVCKKAARSFEELTQIHVSESEIGYLATYIELGLNECGYTKQDNNYHIVVVCTMGIATSKILTARVQREFTNIQVEEQVSAVDMEEYDFTGIDFVLSTVDVSATVGKPIIIINPMLNREDIRKISDYMLEHGNQDHKVVEFTKVLDIIKATCQIQDEVKLENSLRQVMGFRKEIVIERGLLDILKPEFCTCEIEALSWEEALQITARPLLEHGYIEERYLEEIKKNQEKYTHFYMIGDEISMPHAAFMQVSSDSVFSGNTLWPYSEFDIPDPNNIYGQSKYLAEKAMTAICSKLFIVRVPMLFGFKGKPGDNQMFEVWDKMKNGEMMHGATDQICNPTYTKDAAECMMTVAESGLYGTYHISNEGLGSRYDLLVEYAKLAGLPYDTILTSNSEAKYDNRSTYTAFNAIAFKKTFGIELDDWHTAMHRMYEDYKAYEEK